MKIAKIKGGVVQHVWPNAKGKPLPSHYQNKLDIYLERGVLVEVEDYVRPNMVWNEEKQFFGKKPKIVPPKRKDYLLRLLIERLGMNYDEMLAEAKARKKVEWDAYHAAYREAFNKKPSINDPLPPRAIIARK